MSDHETPRPESEHKRHTETRLLKNQTGPFARPRQTGPLDVGLGAPWVMELLINDVPIMLHMEDSRRLVIGRADAQAAVNPDLDLTPYGGLEKGVSRRHAAIIARKDRLVILDLNSTNGTFVNEQRLRPMQPYRLRHGDEIRLGEVRIAVRLAITPLHDSAFQEQPWVRLQESPGGGAGQRVLIVEPNTDVAEALYRILTKAGFSVQIVRDISGAFYAVTRRMPDAIVLNLAPHDVNGLELCRYVRRVSDAPILIISEDTEKDRIQEVLNAGVDVFLGSPVGVNELVRVISSVTHSSLISNNY